MAARQLDFSTGRLVQPGQQLSNTLSNLSDQLTSYEKLQLAKQERADLEKKRVADSERSDAQLILAQEAGQRAGTTFEQGQADREATMLAAGIDLNDVAFTGKETYGTVTDTPKTAEEIQAFQEAKQGDALEKLLTGEGELAQLNKEYTDLYAPTEEAPSSAETWNKFTQTLPHKKDYTGEIPEEEPAPSLQPINVSAGLKEISLKLQRGDITETQATQERSALIKSRKELGQRRQKVAQDTPKDLNEFEVQQQRQGITQRAERDAKAKEIVSKMEKLVQASDVKVNKAITKDDLSTKEYGTAVREIALSREKVAQQLRDVFKQQVSEEDRAKPEVQAAIQAQIDKKLVTFDTQKAALDKAAIDMGVFQAKESFKAGLKEDLKVVEYALKNKSDIKKNDIKPKDIAAAEGIISMYGEAWTGMFGLGLTDDQELSLEKAKQLKKIYYQQQNR